MNPKDPNKWITDALDRDDSDAIEQHVISDPECLHRRGAFGDTPLLHAVEYGNLAVVEFMLQHGADPNDKGDDGYTCILTAIEMERPNSRDMIRVLLAAGADVNGIGISGNTPLHMAAARGAVEICQLLINCGADIDRRKEIDASETPLMEAAYCGQLGTTKLLLEAGADPRLRDTIRNFTVADIARDAAKGASPEVIKTLSEETVDFNMDEIFGEMDLPEDQLQLMKSMMGQVNLSEQYVTAANENVEKGDHAAVISLLENAFGSKPRRSGCAFAVLQIAAATVYAVLQHCLNKA